MLLITARRSVHKSESLTNRLGGGTSRAPRNLDARKTLNFEWFSTGNRVLGTHVTRAGLGDCGNTSHPIAGQQMARLALALALCCGAAHGLGETTNPECSRVRYEPGNQFIFRPDRSCDFEGESCDYPVDEDDEIEGVCLKLVVEDTTQDPPVSTCAQINWRRVSATAES